MSRTSTLHSDHELSKFHLDESKAEEVVSTLHSDHELSKFHLDESKAEEVVLDTNIYQQTDRPPDLSDDFSIPL